MRLVVAGASGFIGTALVKGAEEAGWAVETLTRPRDDNGVISDGNFDPGAGYVDKKVLAGADAVISLNGAGLLSRPWTAAYKKTLVESRLRSVNTLVSGISRLSESERPKHLITGSAIGYYGANRGDEVLFETTKPERDFLSGLCVRWERAGKEVENYGVKHSALRTGLVMDGGGGMLGLLKHLYQAGLGAKLGSGKQWMSPISLRDYVAATLHIVQEGIAGPVNLVGPHPVRNAEWHRELAAHVHKPGLLAVPGFAMKLALGDFAEQAALASQRVFPAVLDSSGFTFQDPTLADILRAALPATPES